MQTITAEKAVTISRPEASRSMVMATTEPPQINMNARTAKIMIWGGSDQHERQDREDDVVFHPLAGKLDGQIGARMNNGHELSQRLANHQLGTNHLDAAAGGTGTSSEAAKEQHAHGREDRPLVEIGAGKTGCRRDRDDVERAVA